MNRTATLGARLRLDGSGFTESLNTAGEQSQRFAGNLNHLGQRAQNDLSHLSRRFTGDLSRMTGRASSELSRVGRQFSSNVRRMGDDAGGGAGGASNKWTELASKVNLVGTGLEIAKAGGGFMLDQAKGALEQEIMIDSVARGLASVSDGSETVAEQMKAIAESAKLPGTGFKEIAEGSLKLQAVGIAAKDSRETLVQFGNALANVGGGKAELEGVTDALTDMFGAGAVEDGAMDQIAARYPAIRGMMANIDTSSPASFLKGVVAELQKLPRAGGNAADAMDNLSDAYKAFVNNMTQGKLNTTIAEAVNSAASVMEAKDLGSAFSALKEGLGKTLETAKAPLTGFEKYEVSAEELAKRKQKKEEDAAKVKERNLKKATDLMQEQLDQLDQQSEIAEAVAAGDEKRKNVLEQQLAIMKEAKKMAEEQKITEQQAAELIERRLNAERRLKNADPAKVSARKKIQEEVEIAALRDKGKNKQADKLEEEHTVRDREDQLRETGFSEEEARHIAGEESKRRTKERDLQKRGGRKFIKGAKSEPTPTGIGSETHVFQQGDQDGDEPIFQPTGMKWKPRLLRNPDGIPAGDQPIPPPASGSPDLSIPAPEAKPKPKPTPPPPAAVSPPAPAPDALLPPPVIAPDAAPPPPAPRTSPGPLPRRERNPAPEPSPLDWKPRLLRKPDGSAVSDQSPAQPSALDWKPRLLQKPDGTPVSVPDEPLFRDGAIAGQPEPPEARRRIKGAGSKRPDNSPAPGVGDPRLIPQTNQSATPLADLIIEAKKQTTLLQTIAGSGSVADKTKPQSSN